MFEIPTFENQIILLYLKNPISENEKVARNLINSYTMYVFVVLAGKYVLKTKYFKAFNIAKYFNNK